MHDDYALLWEQPELRPVAPLVLAAWQDGYLTPEELLAIRQTLERGPWGGDVARRALRRWLDPSSPPPPGALSVLHREVKQWLAELPHSERRSLLSLSQALSNQNLEEAHIQEAMSVLTSVREDVDGTELEQRLWSVAGAREPSPGSPDSDQQRVQLLRATLEGDQAPTRDFVREVLSDHGFRAPRPLDTTAYRELVLGWLKALLEQGVLEHCYPNGFAGGRDLQRFVAAFETLAFFDLSLVVKFGVQTGLFAGTVEGLGSAHHQALLEQGLRGELLGCFAMTERGHGSNVRSLRTQAVYEPDEEEFVIHTPDLSAGKEWIGNAAVDGRMAVVFAQLSTLGEEHGVHAFLVPIRDESGQPLRGVRIEDCGSKMGLNGVDNGRLWFDSVRVPRENLLSRFGWVEPSGEYQSPIPSDGKRFFKMLSTLVGGRIAVAGAANAAAKVGLTIATRYAVERTQFEGPDGREQPLLVYRSHQRRLFPRLAATYAVSFAQRVLTRSAAEAHDSGDEALQQEADTLAAGVKALSTWQALDTLQQCREACGGQGYLSVNRIDALRTDTDVFTTFEGDNTVLLTLVANNLLRQYQRSLKQKPVRTLVRGWVEYVVDTASERNPLAVRDASSEALRSLDFQATALRFRERTLLRALTRRLSRRMRDGMGALEAFQDCQDHGLAAAQAHIEHFVFDAFSQAAEAQPALTPLCVLYGLWRIEADQAWFLENDFLAPNKSRAVRRTMHTLMEELAHTPLDWVEAFGVPAFCAGPLADPEYLQASGLTSTSRSDEE